MSLQFLPHLVTIARGCAGPVVLWLLLHDAGWPAFWVFTVAALTDLVDGWLARRLGSNPQVGLVLDVGADRVLGWCTWGGLWALAWAPPWMAAAFFVRDGVTVAGWIATRWTGRHYAPSRLGQVATSFEGTAMGILLFHGPWLGVHWPSVGAMVGLTALLTSFGSLARYSTTPPSPA